MRRQQPPTPDAAGTSRDPFSLLSAPIGCAYDNVVRAADMAGTGMKASAAPLRLLASDAAQLGATGIADGGRWAGRGIYSGIRFIGLRCLRDNLARVAYVHNQAQRYVAEMVDVVLDKMVVRKIVHNMGNKMRVSAIPPGAPRCIEQLAAWVYDDIWGTAEVQLTESIIETVGFKHAEFRSMRITELLR